MIFEVSIMRVIIDVNEFKILRILIILEFYFFTIILSVRKLTEVAEIRELINSYQCARPICTFRLNKIALVS